MRPVERPVLGMELRVRPAPWEPHETYVFGTDSIFHYQPQYGPGSPEHHDRSHASENWPALVGGPTELN